MPAQLFIKALCYQADSAHLMTKLATMSHPVWLESRNKTQGRFDILAATPSAIFCSKRDGNPQNWANEQLQRRKLPRAANLPFCGGIIGALSYDFGLSLHGLDNQDKTAISSELFLGWYDWAIIVDHKACKTLFVSQQTRKDAETTLQQLQKSTPKASNTFKLSDKLGATFSRSDYEQAFDAVQQYIRAGDCYQINLAQHYRGGFTGDALELFLRMRERSHSPYCAYLDGGSFELLSFSPERFIEVRDGKISSEPIKGTSARHSNSKADRASALALMDSSKNQAENLMIVDLLRNDLGKVCTPGSIDVPQLFALQSFTSVHHLVSKVRGQLSPGHSCIDALMAAFPGGSITGAPKHRAMQIIDELEPDRRSFYCGSLFYASADGQLDSNILIRSLVCSDGEIHCWGGGGLVADSQADSEWQEIDDKIGHLIAEIGA
jgi:para-aminobenzoate synthetase component 1